MRHHLKAWPGFFADLKSGQRMLVTDDDNVCRTCKRVLLRRIETKNDPPGAGRHQRGGPETA